MFVPVDEGYHDARRVWNGGIDRRPAVITCCESAADVAAAIDFALQQDLEISVRGGGHNVWGAAVSTGGMMIHLGGMNGVSVDPAARRVRVGGGALLADMDAATQAHGLATTTGMVSHTGVGGLTLGGGFGWLAHRHGLAIDNLLSAEIVTADGQVLRASQEDNPDLFWALRGGGGNFGVVTEFEFRLHEVGPMVDFGLFFSTWTTPPRRCDWGGISYGRLPGRHRPDQRPQRTAGVVCARAIPLPARVRGAGCRFRSRRRARPDRGTDPRVGPTAV